MLPSRNTIPQSAMIGIDKMFCLFGLRLYVPVSIFFSHIETEPPLPG